MRNKLFKISFNIIQRINLKFLIKLGITFVLSIILINYGITYSAKKVFIVILIKSLKTKSV